MSKQLTIPAREIPSFGTCDERLRDGGWEVVTFCSTNRDADVLTRANHAALANALAEVDAEGEAHEVMHSNHWAVGWCDQFIVDPTNTAVMHVLTDCAAALENYPVLDEDLMSALEFDDHHSGVCGEHCSVCEGDRLDSR